MEKTKTLILTFLSLALILTAGACSTAQETAQPKVETTVEEYSAFISATGEVVPEKFARLSVKSAGVVAEVLVEEGDVVAAGQALIRLEGAEQLQAAVSAAEYELASAQFALNQLYKDLDLRAAQALQAKDQAEKALEDLLNPELQQALALKAIADAKKAVENAERRWRTVNSIASEADIEAQKAQVVLARDALEKAQEDFKPYENKPEDNLARANFQAKLAAAQQAYDAAVRQLNALLGTGSQADIAVAEADLAAAKAQLAEAEREWERVKQGPNPADVALLEAQIAKAQRDYETFSQGPDPDEVALAEARLANAEAQLEAAKAALANLELVAPFTGTISEVNIKPSEWVNPGQAAVVLADLSRLRVETTDLSEIDVAQIDVGETVIVTFDALPEVVVEGTIVRIAPKANEGSGVNYTVIVEIAEIPAKLRWGMTAFVDIELE